MPRSLRKSISGFFRNTKPPTDDLPPPLPTTPLPSLVAETQRLSFVETPPKPSKPAVKPTRPAQLITPEMLRELRETIRLRYALDIEIWRQRDAKPFARDRLKENMKRSEAALERIRKTLTAWDREEYFKTPQEHAKFQEIKRRLMEGEKANWTQKPPWEFAYHGGNPYDGRMEADGRMAGQEDQSVGPKSIPVDLKGRTTLHQDLGMTIKDFYEG
ncbi:hypothetical protein SLS59_008208 [Nothophoma quercina]|uniref:Mitochondrial ribosomal protein L28 n=1 Tax=Nothophoma quercina TaxID=749835 RepID=A0ABR3QTS8_9PLEO